MVYLQNVYKDRYPALQLIARVLQQDVCNNFSSERDIDAEILRGVIWAHPKPSYEFLLKATQVDDSGKFIYTYPLKEICDQVIIELWSWSTDYFSVNDFMQFVERWYTYIEAKSDCGKSEFTDGFIWMQYICFVPPEIHSNSIIDFFTLRLIVPNENRDKKDGDPAVNKEQEI